MSIGLVEFVGLFVVALVSLLLFARWKQRWILMLPAFYLVAMLLPPPDIVSTLLIAVPNCVLFACGMRWFGSGAVAP